jgi:hypothetical protein
MYTQHIISPPVYKLCSPPLARCLNVYIIQFFWQSQLLCQCLEGRGAPTLNMLASWVDYSAASTTWFFFLLLAERPTGKYGYTRFTKDLENKLLFYVMF